ncbi:trypsin-like peptidase domain-containing protein [Streptomyces iconiensis]|uniref:Serine protease n=1 Tax=Streptomyces iconiensis TaxID=1384038 RepID=A0ABT6ZU83_9ACTN|nr:serine protease [Streptomyces iconiensis]MDJ1132630.1 serine protease [Streptomyces iconiensis]
MSAVRGETTLVRICDLAGRARGSGFLADSLGTLVTSHEAVDGLSRAVVHAPGDRTFLAESGDITPLPEWDLALLRTEGLGLTPLVIGAERPHLGGTAVVIAGEEPIPATVSGTVAATYTSTDRYHPLEQVLELALPEAASVQLRLSRRVSGAPVLDVATGSVLGVLGTALHTPGRACGYAVPLYAAGVLAPEGPLGVLLRRNGASVPGFGADLNLAGALQLTATSVGSAVERCARAVARPQVAGELGAFAAGPASVVGLVGPPGTGRTTELAALAARRARGAAPAPTVWLRGADLRADDGSVREAVARALAAAGRIVTASWEAARTEQTVGDPGDANPDVVARLARTAGRPLLVLLDAPEEMPPQLAYRLRQWTIGTASWLRASGARMAVACGPEYWEQAVAPFPGDMLHTPGSGAAAALTSGDPSTPAGQDPARGPGPARAPRGDDGAPLPGCVRLGDLPQRLAARARAAYGLPDGALAPADAGHPLAMRMLSEVRAAQTGQGHARPSRAQIFSAHLDLVCLRVALRLVAGERPTGRYGSAMRRLAARVSGRLHEAARRCLGPGQGELSRAAFEELFPWGGGWAPAVLAEGVLGPAGDGYRFADEEFADWLQGRHLELDSALDALVHRRSDSAAVPVPRHRLGPVVQALLLRGRRAGPEALAQRLLRLVGELGPPRADARAELADDAVWWASHLLSATLLRVQDARPYTRVLRALAERVAAAAVDAAVGAAGAGMGAGAGNADAVSGGSERDAAGGGGSEEWRRALWEGFGPWFWRRLPLRTAEKAELLRLLLPADPPYVPEAWSEEDASRGDRRPRYLDVLGDLLQAEPRAVQRLLCEWFSDLRPLRQRGDAGPELAPTVATAAQALLHTFRHRAVDDLVEALVDAAHPRADELLAELVHDEPSAVCRAVEGWAHDTRAERRVAAATYGVRAARRIRTESDREPLRRAAAALLDRPGDRTLHHAALALLVRDPGSRSRYLGAGLERFAATGDAELASALGAALSTHPEPVFAAFHALLTEAGGTGPGLPEAGVTEPGVMRPGLTEPGRSVAPAQAQVLRALAEVRTPALARRAALLVREYAARSPTCAQDAVAAFVRRRLGHGPAARAVMRPLVDELLRTQGASFRAGLARALGSGEGALRDELLDVLLVAERELPVLEAALDAVVRHGLGRRAEDGQAADLGAAGQHRAGQSPAGQWPEGELVRRIGLRMARTPQGAASFDRGLVGLARELPGFAGAVREWVAGSPGAWTAVVGPSARRMCDSLDDRSRPQDGEGRPGRYGGQAGQGRQP